MQEYNLPTSPEAISPEGNRSYVVAAAAARVAVLEASHQQMVTIPPLKGVSLEG